MRAELISLRSEVIIDVVSSKPARDRNPMHMETCSNQDVSLRFSMRQDGILDAMRIMRSEISLSLPTSTETNAMNPGQCNSSIASRTKALDFDSNPLQTKTY